MKPVPPQIRTIIIWTVSLVLCLSAGSTVIHLWARRGVVREREQELAVLQKKNSDLENSLKEASGDAYVERVARDKLGMVREGETIIIMPDTQPRTAAGQGNDVSPNWKKWWGLFF